MSRAEADRWADGPTAARARRERLLVCYLTVADPLWDGLADFVPALVDAGMDVLELGLPTPSTWPRGARVASSFQRAAGVRPADVWHRLGALRDQVPATPIVLLIYPGTVADIGRDQLIGRCLECGVDGLVITRPSVPEIARVAAAGLSAIPLIQATADPRSARALEKAAGRLTYRALAATTGDPLEAGSLARHAARLADESSIPFLAGFGIRSSAEIRTLAPFADGVVVGSELLRIMSDSDPVARASAAAGAVRGWKAATVLGAARAVTH